MKTNTPLIFLLLNSSLAKSSPGRPLFGRWRRTEKLDKNLGIDVMPDEENDNIDMSSMHSFTGAEGMDHHSHVEDYPAIGRRRDIASHEHDDSAHKEIIHSSSTMHSFTGAEGMHDYLATETEKPEANAPKPKRKNRNHDHSEHVKHVKSQVKGLNEEATNASNLPDNTPYDFLIPLYPYLL